MHLVSEFMLNNC